MHVFDALDRRLISVLREDGRAPISKLGTILGISRATVQSRLDRLIETGAVLGFTVRFRQDYDVDAIRAIMMIEVSGKSTTAVIRQLRGLPELHSLHTTNGTWDLIAEIRSDSLTDFDRVLREAHHRWRRQQRDQHPTEFSLDRARVLPARAARAHKADDPLVPIAVCWNRWLRGGATISNCYLRQQSETKKEGFI
jgi:DNA-binding Lrp family transcriptional regulator